MSTLRGRSYLLDSYVYAEVQQALDAMLSRDAYDAVLFESVFMVGYRIPEHLPMIIDEHNIEYELLQRTYQHEKGWLRKGYNWWEGRLLKPVELERCRRAPLVLVTSERERLLLKQHLSQSHIEVVPNGVDIDVFDAPAAGGEASTIIFTGTMNYYPNIDAVLFFARECWPLIRARVPDATWLIVGKDPAAEVRNVASKASGITVTGTVPDVRPYLAKATVAIAPVRIGSGTRLKILEALAMRKAVVSTNLGCEGLSVVAGSHLRVADAAQAFAQAVVDVLQDAEQRMSLGNAGRGLVEANYSWRRCGAMAVDAIMQMNKINR
jgi:polysaccharide biosynthesis protein PslH